VIIIPEATMKRIVGSLLAAALLATLAADAAAQSAPAGLRRRMDAFAAALRDEAPVATIASFFPRDAAWEMVRTPERPTPQPAVETIRIAADSTLAAIRKDGRICDSFTGTVGDVGPVETTLGMQMRMHDGPWRYAGRLRFVPPGEPASSPTYVEWRRERGSWVVSRVGEQYYYFPRVLGVDAHDRASRDTTAGSGLPLERRLAAEQRWYRENAPITVGGRRYIKYGLPRPLPDSVLTRFGTVGVVPVYVERSEEERPWVVYVLATPGQYQPYETHMYGGCRAE
jgi:hypothetical protein